MVTRSLSDLILISEKMPINGERITFKLITFQYLKLRKKCIHEYGNLKRFNG